MLTIVGQGLVGTLVALEAEKRGRSFRIVDQGSGQSATRAAAGLFNPLTGPRFSPDTQGWDQIVPFYREIEQTLGVALVHPLPLMRPLTGAKVGPGAFPQAAPGWSADLVLQEGSPWVRIEGGGWVDLPALLDATRARWLGSGRLEERWFTDDEGDETVLWCGGPRGLFEGPWSLVPRVGELSQGVRGDTLTVRIGLTLDHVELGPRFLLPLGGERFRWGATHESDVLDYEFRPEARTLLEGELRERLAGASFEVVDHKWGVRPASRTKEPLVLRHPDRAGWLMVNGFGGRGVALVPRWLDRVFEG